MRIRLLLISMVLCLAGSLSLGLFYAIARLEVSTGVTIHAATDFYKPLAACGTWVEVGSYGRCWRPTGVSADWRPYCNGDWEWTDAGWYWVSDEPWAWACYHYGTWVYDSYDGWVWVPGIEWAPAWVCWRMGGNYIGWASCGPAGFTVEPSFYVFVESRYFHDRVRPATVIVNNPAVIRNTTEINNLKREQREFDGKSQTVVVNEGPRVNTMEKATGHKFAVVPVREADRSTYRSIPKTLKHPAAKPATDEKSRVRQPPPSSVPEHKLTPGRNSEVPGNLPPEKTIPPGQTTPLTSPERIVPPANRQLPPTREPRYPKEVVPPAQPTPHAPNPAAPSGNPVPNKKEQDREKHIGHAEHAIQTQSQDAQKPENSRNRSDGLIERSSQLLIYVA